MQVVSRNHEGETSALFGYIGQAAGGNIHSDNWPELGDTLAVIVRLTSRLRLVWNIVFCQCDPVAHLL